MAPLFDRAAALKEQDGAKKPKSPVYPDGLTRREVEVIRLVAAGKTDREIADELFISINCRRSDERSINGKWTPAEHWQTLERWRDSPLIAHQTCPTNGVHHRCAC